MPVATADDGVSLAYESRGEGPPDVLFMHGWGGAGRYFDATIEQLDLTRMRAVTLDLRGHGGSDRADGGYDLDQLAADAFAVADAAGMAELTIVGYSMSAKFAQYMALLEPARVRGLILLAGCPAGEIPLPDELVSDWMGREGDARRMTEIALAYAANPIPQELLDRFGEDAAAIPRAALQGTLDAGTRTSFMDRVGEITAPVLAIGGLHDMMFTPELMRDAVTAPLPSARLALLDAGHEIALEAPRQLAALIEAFLAGAQATSAGSAASSASISDAGRGLLNR